MRSIGSWLVPLRHGRLWRRAAQVEWNACQQFKGRNAHVAPVDNLKGTMKIPSFDRDPSTVKVQQYNLFKHDTSDNSYKPTSFAPNAHNEIEAVKARVLKQTPVVDLREMASFVKFVKKNFKHLFPRHKKRRSFGIDQYLDNSNASPGVKQAIRRAHDELEARGITEDSSLSYNELYKMTTRKSFVKVEVNLYNSPAGYKNKAPRLIQGATPEFIALVGPAFMAIQQEIKRIWGKKHFVWFTSGAKSKELADYITEFESWKIFENDVSSWDASMHEELGKLEVWIAKQFGARRAVLDLMTANIHTHGVTSKGVKYKVKGTRKSGDPYTSLFNSVINGLIHLYCLHKSGVPVTGFKDAVRMVVQGDDNLMRHPPQLQVDWSIIEKLGFKAENLYREDEYQAEFCSSRLYPVDDGKNGFCFGPKLGRVLNKLLCFTNPPKNEHPMAIARGVAMGMREMASYVPHLGVVVDSLLAQTEGHEAISVKQESWRMNYSFQKPDMSRYPYAMSSVYGLDTSDQKMLTKQLSQLKIGGSIGTPFINCLFDKDTSATKVLYAPLAA